MRIALTGANSSVGMNLLNHANQHGDLQFIAGVRSEKARESLPQSEQIEGRCIDYRDGATLAKQLEGADCVVHLAGILIESSTTKYQEANVDATRVVVEAAKILGVRHLVFISVVGANASSTNSYFRSKGQAEELVANSGLSATIIRTPILLGPGTAGANALIGSAKNSKPKALGGGLYKMRPLDIDDLNTAIINACKRQAPACALYELVGPTAIRYCDLINMTARALGASTDIEVGSISITVSKFIAKISSTLRGGGFTPTVIEVITQDEVVAHNAAEELGVSLTPLTTTIEKILEQQ